ncbi:hypothetical protein BD410DRAFT_718764 [Rickenella mellea]|uniref:Zn(2)-C6 fungal-type domain-containing protein n=1 Tax=Rickenella mellea TaxID=50990 RepID=A0A4Y7QDV4_9AGAM|nr:hypothetical protein BD410DRAFT_718764 [Rickenella mellea]
MSEVHFVFEKPQKHDRPEKKRSRLVTSCDACRSRKIKCRPSGFGDDVCEACKIASSNCVYEERDRIRAERGIANFTVAPANAIQTPTKTLAAKRVARGSAKSSSRSVSRPPQPVRRPSEDERTTDSDSTKSQSPPVRDHNNVISLFDHRRPDYPSPNLLPHFVSLFFPHVGDRFPWLDPEDTLRSAVAGTLNPAVANCIAAFAARFSDRMPRSADHRCFAGEPYVDMAKSLLATAMDPPSLETLQGLIMIAYLESGTPRQESFFAYTEAACVMAGDLNILYEDIIMLAESERSRVVMRMTFWSVAWLDLYACSCNGKPSVFVIETSTTGVPFSTRDGSSQTVHLYRSLKQLYIVMSVLKDVAIGASTRRASPIRELGLKEMRRFLATFQAQLPADVAFTREALLQAEANYNLQYFVLLHMLIHTLVVVVHCPALFWIAQSDDTVVDAPQVSAAWSSARFVVDILLTVNGLDSRLLVGTPSFLFPLSIARAAFSLEQAYAGVPWSTFGGSSNGAYTVQSDCQEYVAKVEDLASSISVYV